MSKKKIWLFIVAPALILLGCALMLTALSMVDFDFAAHDREGNVLEKELHTFESLEGIDVSVIDFDVVILPSADERIYLSVPKSDKVYCEVREESGYLTVEQTDERKWYDWLRSFPSYTSDESATVLILLPEAEYKAIRVETISGDIEVQGEIHRAIQLDEDGRIVSTEGTGAYCSGSALELKLKTTSGDIEATMPCTGTLELESVSGEIESERADGCVMSVSVTSGYVCVRDGAPSTLRITATTGKVKCTNLRVENAISVDVTTGDVSLLSCDATGVSVKTVSGDVSVSLIGEWQFDTRSVSGDVSIGGETRGGRSCVVRTTSGDMHLSDKGQ